MLELQQRIVDSRVLELIESFLKQQILEDLKQWTPEAGSPQGAAARCCPIFICTRWTRQ
jgi:RNA-directed DNA polymerase